MTDDGGADGDLAARMVKLESRVSALEAAEYLPLARALVDGRIQPVDRRLCQTESQSQVMRLLLDVLACAIILGVLLGGLLWWHVDKPWPFRFTIPPPHSTQHPKEGP